MSRRRARVAKLETRQAHAGLPDIATLLLEARRRKRQGEGFLVWDEERCRRLEKSELGRRMLEARRRVLELRRSEEDHRRRAELPRPDP
jgi:hypothetical protein